MIAGAAAFARELANTPPTYLNAKDIAAKAVELGPDAGLEVEVFEDRQVLRGRFEFPSADVSGRFRARECPTGTLFDLLAVSPVASCPILGGPDQ